MFLYSPTYFEPGSSLYRVAANVMLILPADTRVRMESKVLRVRIFGLPPSGCITSSL